MVDTVLVGSEVVNPLVWSVVDGGLSNDATPVAAPHEVESWPVTADTMLGEAFLPRREHKHSECALPKFLKCPTSPMPNICSLSKP